MLANRITRAGVMAIGTENGTSKVQIPAKFVCINFALIPLGKA